MRQDVPTLAGDLSSRGYDTAGFAANLDYCSRETGLARGFAHYEDFPIDLFDALNRYTALGHRIDIASWAFVLDTIVEKCTGRWYNLIPKSKEHSKNAEAIDQSFLNWLTRRTDKTRPFFAFLNYNDAHSPYEVPDQTTAGFGLQPTKALERQTLVQWTALDKSRVSYHDVRMVNDLYDDCIAYLDRRLGSLLDELKRRGVLENTLVIVTADHGEHLGDHLLFFHGCSLYRQLVQVPLVIIGAKNRVPVGRSVAEPVSLFEMPSTIIDLLGFKPNAVFSGQSLARYWKPRMPGVSISAEPLLMETTKPEVLTNQGREPAAKGPMKSIVARGMHYIRSADGSEELYMLNHDAEERINLASAATAPPVLEQFRELLNSLLAKRPALGVRD